MTVSRSAAVELSRRHAGEQSAASPIARRENSAGRMLRLLGRICLWVPSPAATCVLRTGRHALESEAGPGRHGVHAHPCALSPPAQDHGMARLGFLNEIFGDATFIPLVRDGRAVAQPAAARRLLRGWYGPQGWRAGLLSPEDQATWEASDCSFVALAGLEWRDPAPGHGSGAASTA